MREQILAKEGRLPGDHCLRWRLESNAIRAFHQFLNDESVRLIGVGEVGGRGKGLGDHAALASRGVPGVLQEPVRTLQDGRQVSLTHSVSAGFGYAGRSGTYGIARLRPCHYVSADDGACWKRWWRGPRRTWRSKLPMPYRVPQDCAGDAVA